MADNVAITAGTGTTVSTEEVTTLNGASATAQHAQRVLMAVRTGDGLVSDVPMRPYGPLRVSMEEKSLFYDPYDGAVLDTTNRWVTPTGTNLPVQTAGNLTFGVTTTASIYGKITSQPSFNAIIPGYLQVSFLLKLDPSGAAAISGHRFFGLGISPTTPATTSASTKLTDAVGFEVDTDGKMYASVYNTGSRTFNTDLSSTGTGVAQSQQPLDGGWHRYIIQYRTDRTYFFIDSLTGPVATATVTPAQQGLPVLMQTINPAASVAAGGYPLTIQGSVVADTAGHQMQLSDGTYQWRKAKVGVGGGQAVVGLGASNIATSQVTVTTTAATLIAARSTRQRLVIYNDSNQDIYIGPATVTTANGLRVPAGYTLTLQTTALVQAIIASGTMTGTVDVLEEYDT